MSERADLECLECGHRFKKKLGKYTASVKCPKCGGYDTDLASPTFPSSGSSSTKRQQLAAKLLDKMRAEGKLPSDPNRW